MTECNSYYLKNFCHGPVCCVCWHVMQAFVCYRRVSDSSAGVWKTLRQLGEPFNKFGLCSDFYIFCASNAHRMFPPLDVTQKVRQIRTL